MQKSFFYCCSIDTLHTMGRRYLDHSALGLFPFSALRFVLAFDLFCGDWQSGLIDPEWARWEADARVEHTLHYLDTAWLGL